MQTTSSETISTLNDLVLINNDRIAGYEKALEELRDRDDNGASDADLVTLFGSMITDSREFRNELGKEVQVLGGEMAEGTMTSGKIYRAWMDVKAIFTGKDRHTILASCEGGEDAAQKAYKSALAEEDLSASAREMISSQQIQLKRAHDQIKALRDASKN
ncbi:MAG: PA2169 family four-helix-bundle protein [Chitinophagaceae bacterium]|nr:MAG: PA2169 family four-helix-bundle protein [Chitinophagaceae bacterium]